MWISHSFIIFFVLHFTVCVCSLSRVRFFVIPQTVTDKAPLSIGLSKQGSWSGLPFPPPEDLPNPGIEPSSPAPLLSHEGSLNIMSLTIRNSPSAGFYFWHLWSFPWLSSLTRKQWFAVSPVNSLRQLRLYFHGPPVQTTLSLWLFTCLFTSCNVPKRVLGNQEHHKLIN